jgi:lysophospholipase L1-like esterase
MAELEVRDGQSILFVGDSITGCGRQKEGAHPLGNGYVRLFSEMLIARYPDRSIQVINKGIGGNCIVDLRERWHDDVLSLEPDWLSIAIGINDVHSFLFDGQPKVSPALFGKLYDEILDSVAPRLRGRMLVLDPFYLRSRYDEGTREARVLEALPHYLDVVHSMKAKYGARLIATHEVFQEHLRLREPAAFCEEPVHPNQLGHLVIAEEVMRTVSAQAVRRHAGRSCSCRVDSRAPGK